MNIAQTNLESQQTKDNLKQKTKDQQIRKNDSINSSPQIKKNQKQQIKLKEIIDHDLIILQKMKSAELFFNKKYLGNKDQSKVLDLKRLLKIPNSKEHNSQIFSQLKTGNLNLKMKQIQTIFKADKKTKIKKIFIPTEMTDFQLYLTKRDILKQKNTCIDDIRKQYEEDKKILEAKKVKKNKKNIVEDIKEQNKLNQIKLSQKPIVIPVQQAITIPERQLTLLQLNNQIQNLQEKNSSVKYVKIQIENAKNNPAIKAPFDDNYFQKQFEQKIVRNKLAPQDIFSIRSFIDPSDKRRTTTMNNGAFIKMELNQIEHVAKSTIDNFQIKQKINKSLYGNNFQFNEHQSDIQQKRQSLDEAQSFQLMKKDKKSINWIIRQCDNFKKQFNVRKTKSMKHFKKVNRQ